MHGLLKDIVISQNATILDAMKAIDNGAVQLALVVDHDGRLIASITDGDVRRGLLRGVSLDASISEVMRIKPLTVRQQDGPGAARRLMREHRLHQIPIIDDAGRIVGLELIDQMIVQPANDTWVVLMAGGLGKRLRPLTESIPKPMIHVGGRPLLETIVCSMTEQGFRKFFISLNYQGQVIKDYFGDGAKFDAEIQYLTEDQQLGTAGALSLLPERPNNPFIVMNGDLVTSIQFNQLLSFHKETKADATLCVREHTTKIRYGVVKVEGTQLKGIEEKPNHTFLANAGIYVLNPQALAHVPEGMRFDMPRLFDAVAKSGGTASVFPIREYWLDIGQMEDLERATREIDDVFDT